LFGRGSTISTPTSCRSSTRLPPLAAFFPRGTAGDSRSSSASAPGHFARRGRLRGWRSTTCGEDVAALRRAAELHARYPNNPIFHLYLARSHAVRDERDATRQVCGEILARARSGGPAYGSYQAEAALYFLARADLAEARYAAAVERLTELEVAARARASQSRWRTLRRCWCAAWLHDAAGERRAAQASYREALRLRRWRCPPAGARLPAAAVRGAAASGRLTGAGALPQDGADFLERRSRRRSA
jgi:hypothetical protein